MIEIESAIKKSVIDVKGKTFTEIETQQAVRWFKENCCHAWVDDGSVYVEIDNDNFEVFNVQISTSEIAYRADLYRSENK
jgi:hypothetical protein